MEREYRAGMVHLSADALTQLPLQSTQSIVIPSRGHYKIMWHSCTARGSRSYEYKREL